MNDTELLDFIQDNGIQLSRNANGIWQAQMPNRPFVNCGHINLRTALHALREKLLLMLNLTPTEGG